MLPHGPVSPLARKGLGFLMRLAGHSPKEKTHPREDNSDSCDTTLQDDTFDTVTGAPVDTTDVLAQPHKEILALEPDPVLNCQYPAHHSPNVISLPHLAAPHEPNNPDSLLPPAWILSWDDNFPRITVDRLHLLLLDCAPFHRIVVVDCRFPYEHEGGHISGSTNVPQPAGLAALLGNSVPGTLYVFHCEFSVFRGPTMAGQLRRADRNANAHRYPHLLCPDVAILEGGYKQFFAELPHFCLPRGYVAMNDSTHRARCDAGMAKVLLALKLTRAKLCNQFTPHLLHCRLASYTEPRRRTKVQKTPRLRIEPRAMEYGLLVSVATCPEFSPPPALFRDRVALPLSLLDVSLSLADELPFSSTDSLAESSLFLEDVPSAGTGKRRRRKRTTTPNSPLLSMDTINETPVELALKYLDRR